MTDSKLSPDASGSTKDEKKLVVRDESKSDKNKQAAVMKLVESGKKITATAIKAIAKGDMKAITSFLARNKDFVTAHNDSLKK